MQLSRNLGLAQRIWRAQGEGCAICGGLMLMGALRHPVWGWSIEHVWPRSRYPYRHIGNILIAHCRCNHEKGNRDPTGCELILLAAVNGQLGHRLRVRDDIGPPARSYSDQISAPTALAIALTSAQARIAGS